MGRLTRRQFLRLGAASGVMALGMPLTGCTLTNHSSMTKAVEMSSNRNQINSTAGKVDPAKLKELNLLFEKMIEDGLHPGAQLCVYHQGKLLIELAGGLESPTGRPVTPQTLYQIRSTTKALASLAMMMIYEKGRFAFEDPVAEHWPEFGAGSKQAITIAHIIELLVIKVWGYSLSIARY